VLGQAAYGSNDMSARPDDLQAAAVSFANLYDAHADFVWRNARRLGARPESLDDIVQDVFMVVHRKLHELNSRESLRAWLFSILVRTIQNHKRSLRRKDPHVRSGESALDPAYVADAPHLSPHAMAERSDAVRLVLQALQDLDADKREVFILSELEEMSVPEISEALSVNAHTIQSRVRAARKQFEQTMEKHRARDEWRLR
jgi:RNA polymerase sigma-70 factor, ECF subfamily